LVETLYERAAMARHELHGWPLELAGRGREGEGEERSRGRLLAVGRRKGVPWGYMKREVGLVLPSCAHELLLVAVRRKNEGEEREEKEEKEGEKKRRKREGENFPNLKFSAEKNKR
jgi:hypothetical protein